MQIRKGLIILNMIYRKLLISSIGRGYIKNIREASILKLLIQ